jgi:hypothetical protein
LRGGDREITVVVKIKPELYWSHVFILAYGSFWFQLSGFSSNLTGHHETKTAKPVWSYRSKYSNFYFKSRLPMTNGRPEPIPPLPSSQTPASPVIQVRTLSHFRERKFENRGHWQACNFRQLWDGIFLLPFVSRTKTQVHKRYVCEHLRTYYYYSCSSILNLVQLFGHRGTAASTRVLEYY